MMTIENLEETDDNQYGLMDGKIETMDLLSPKEEEFSAFTATKSLRTLGRRSAS